MKREAPGPHPNILAQIASHPATCGFAGTHGPGYGVVLRRSTALVAKLLAAGVGRDDVLCVATDHRPSVAAAIVASLLGGPRVLLPSSLNPARVLEASASFGACVALVGPRDSTPAGLRPVLVPAEGPEAPPEAQRTLDEPFLHVFTGGSTNRPRAWTKTARNLFCEAELLSRVFDVGPEDTIVATVPPLHIYGLLFSVLLPLVSGASVVEESPFYPHEIVAALEPRPRAVFVGAPIHYQALAGSAFVLPGLRLAFSSGGALPPAPAATFAERTGLRVTEILGSTETGGLAWRRADHDAHAWTPFAGVRWRTDAEKRLLVDSPFLSSDLLRDEDGYFRTGDAVDACGTTGFVLRGRVDGIVKVGANRVDVAAVEGVLRGLPGIRDAQVLAIPEPGKRGARLEALLATDLSPAAARRLLAAALDAPARPRRVVVLAALPFTAAGKRDREAALCLLGAEPHEGERKDP